MGLLCSSKCSFKERGSGRRGTVGQVHRKGWAAEMMPGVRYPAAGPADHTPHSIQAEGRVRVRRQGISTIQDQVGENPWR